MRIKNSPVTLRVAGARAILAWLILRRSRPAWVLTVAACGVQITASILLGEMGVALVSSIIVTVCLLSPEGRRYIWKGRSRRPEAANLRTKVCDLDAGVGYRLLSRVAGWTQDGNTVTRNRGGFGLLAWRLGIAVVLLLIPLNLTHNWSQASHHDDLPRNVIADVVWTCWAVAVFGFAVARILTLYQHGRTISEGSSSPRKDARCPDWCTLIACV
jgi:hypothetical protein